METLSQREEKQNLSHFVITGDRDILFYHEYPQLFMGKNKFGKTIIFSLFDDDRIDENKIFYLSIVLNNRQAENFKNNLIGFIDLLKEVPFVYIIQSNLETEVVKVFEFDFEEIPKEDLPSSNFKYNSIKKIKPVEELVEIERLKHKVVEDKQSVWSYFFDKAIREISFSLGGFVLFFSILWTFRESLDPFLIKNINEFYIIIAFALLIIIVFLTRIFNRSRREYEMKNRLVLHDLWIKEIINDLKLSKNYNDDLLSKSQFLSLLNDNNSRKVFLNSENYYPFEIINHISNNEETLSNFLSIAADAGLIKLFFDNRKDGTIKIKVLK